MGGKDFHRVYHRVLVAEESVDALAALLVGHTAEALGRNGLVFLDQSLSYDEVLHAVLTRVQEGVLAHHAVFQHRVAHQEGRVYHNPVMSVKHFGVHSAHRRAYYQVGILAPAGVPEQQHGLLGVQRKVGGDDRCAGKHLAQLKHRARLSRRSEAVHVEYLLPLHYPGELYLVVYFHCIPCFCRCGGGRWDGRLPSAPF